MSDNSWQQFMSEARARYAQPVPLECRGRLTKLTGMVLEASGLRVPVGAQCHIHQPGQEPVLAEVVGFAGERAFLMPAGDIQGLSSGAMVVPAAPFIPVPQLGVEAAIEKVTATEAILAYDILKTPGLVINEKLVSSGRIPAVGSVVEWIRDAAA